MSAHCSLQQHSCDGNTHSAAVLSTLQCARLYWLLNHPSPANPYSVTFAKLIISRLTTRSSMKTFDCVRACSRWYHTCVSPIGVDIERVCMLSCFTRVQICMSIRSRFYMGNDMRIALRRYAATLSFAKISLTPKYEIELLCTLFVCAYSLSQPYRFNEDCPR